MGSPLVTIACVPREVFSVAERSLEALFARTPAPVEIIYIDGGSPPEVASYLARASRERGFRLLRSETYLSPNQARNLAIKHVKTPYVVFVDNDVLPGEGWLQPLVDCAEETGAWAVAPLYFEFLPEQHRVHMVGGLSQIRREADGTTYYFEEHLHAHRLLSALEEPLVRQETELVEFHTLLVSMAAFAELGPLDEGLMSRAEHADLSLTIRKAGQRIFVEPASRITYAPPQRLAETDRDFWALRWSEAWGEASIDHHIRKWGLLPRHPRVAVTRRWARKHRQYAWSVSRFLGKFLPGRYGPHLAHLLVGGAEAFLNRRRYPTSVHGTLRVPEVEWVNNPSAEDPSSH